MGKRKRAQGETLYGSGLEQYHGNNQHLNAKNGSPPKASLGAGSSLSMSQEPRPGNQDATITPHRNRLSSGASFGSAISKFPGGLGSRAEAQFGNQSARRKERSTMDFTPRPVSGFTEGGLSNAKKPRRKPKRLVKSNEHNMISATSDTLKSATALSYNDGKSDKQRKRKRQHDPTETPLAEQNGTPKELSNSTAKDIPATSKGSTRNTSGPPQPPAGSGHNNLKRWRRKMIKQGLLLKNDDAGTSSGDAQTTHLEVNSGDAEPLRPPPDASPDQVKRWLKKQIKKGLLSQADNTGPPEQSMVSEAVAENPKSPANASGNGNKTDQSFAKRLSTTALLPPPPKRWVSDSHATEPRERPKPAASRFHKWRGTSNGLVQYNRAIRRGNPASPWQRSAYETERVTLPSASPVHCGSEPSANPVPTMDGAADTARSVPESYQTKHWLGSSLGSNAPPRLSMKRPSIGSKATSVPDFTAGGGDVAERFRRFSAAANGKAVDGGSEESTSESSDDSANGSDDEERSMSVLDKKPAPGESMPTHRTSGNEDTEQSGKHEPPKLYWPANIELKHIAADELPIFGEQQDPQESLPPASIIDDENEAYDAHKAVEELTSNMMSSTRALPASKDIHSLVPQEGLLTKHSSDRRLSDSEVKERAILDKRMDSAVAAPGPVDWEVRSMQFSAPEKEPTRPNAESSDGGEVMRAEASGIKNIDVATTSPQNKNVVRHSSSSVLSELGDTPSPPSQRALSVNALGVEPSSPSVIVENEAEATLPTVEQPAEIKKKRKMTGRTSKHFSTPKKRTVKAKRSGNVDPVATLEQASVDDEAADGGSDQPKKAPMSRTTPVKSLLRETRKLIADVQVSPERPKKRSRRSGGTITDVVASNIVEGRSRHATKTGTPEDANDDVLEHARDGKQAEDETEVIVPTPTGGEKEGRVAEVENNASAKGGEEKVTEEPPSKKRKRSRRSSGTLANLDESNIIDSRSRRGTLSVGNDVTAADEPEIQETSLGATVPEEAETAPAPKRKRKSTGKRSEYFTPTKPALDPAIIDRVDFYNTTAKKGRVPAGTSTAPVPPIHSDRFGIIQEKLWQEPFWLIIAVTFLNKTTGRAAAPTFWAVKERYPSPEALAEADQGEVLEMVKHLGFQNQRSKRLISIAKAWLEREPAAGVRWRTLHYPLKNDGKSFKKGASVEEDADEVEGALEIGHIPGCGAYAWDSWRIFCRDVLRGVAEDYNGSNSEAKGFVPEWQKVIPLDKELRACLRWMWLREGYIWNHETGDKREATEEEMERAVKGEMEVADPQEGRFAAQAAADEDVYADGEEFEAELAGVTAPEADRSDKKKRKRQEIDTSPSQAIGNDAAQKPKRQTRKSQRAEVMQDPEAVDEERPKRKKRASQKAELSTPRNIEIIAKDVGRPKRRKASQQAEVSPTQDIELVAEKRPKRSKRKRQQDEGDVLPLEDIDIATEERPKRKKRKVSTQPGKRAANHLITD